MLYTYSLLIVSIFQKAYPLSPQPSAEMFLHHFAFEVDRTCGVLESLGLVEKTSSTIGFKPTRRLIDVITDRMAQPTVESKNPAEKVDDNFIADSLRELVSNDYKDDSDGIGDEQKDVDGNEDGKGGKGGQPFCLQVLVFLGLLREKADRYVPTRLMHKLLPENAYVPAHFLRKLILDYWLQQLSKTA
jgi:hypothetical protein